MNSANKSRVWTVILAANFIIAFAVNWTFVSRVAVIINALYVLWLAAKQIREGLN